jgi:hypothetical protein
VGRRDRIIPEAPGAEVVGNRHQPQDNFHLSNMVSFGIPAVAVLLGSAMSVVDREAVEK